MVNAPFEAIEVVAVPPTARVLPVSVPPKSVVVVAFVAVRVEAVSPPLNAIEVVVAFEGNG